MHSSVWLTLHVFFFLTKNKTKLNCRTRLLLLTVHVVPQVAAFTRSPGSLASRRLRARGRRRRAAAALTASWDTAGELTDRGKVGIPHFHRTPEAPTHTNELDELTGGVMAALCIISKLLHTQYLSYVHQGIIVESEAGPKLCASHRVRDSFTGAGFSA